MKKVYVPENVIIENQAFWGCKSLSQVTLAPGVLTHTNCFGGCGTIPRIVCQSQKVYYAAFDDYLRFGEDCPPDNASNVDAWCFDTLQNQSFILSNTINSYAEEVRVKKMYRYYMDTKKEKNRMNFSHSVWLLKGRKLK